MPSGRPLTDYRRYPVGYSIVGLRAKLCRPEQTESVVANSQRVKPKSLFKLAWRLRPQ